MASLSQNEAKAMEKNRSEKVHLENQIKKFNNELTQNTREIKESAVLLNQYIHELHVTTGFAHLNVKKKKTVSNLKGNHVSYR